MLVMRRSRIDRRETHFVILVDIAEIGFDIGLPCPLLPPLHKLDCIEPLPIVNQCWGRPCQLSPIVCANSFRRACSAGSVKQKNHAQDVVELDEVRAFLSQLLCAKKIAAARRQCTSAARNVESVEPADAELFMQKSVGLFLQSSVGTSDDERVWTVSRPFLMRYAHATEENLLLAEQSGRRLPSLG